MAPRTSPGARAAAGAQRAARAQRREELLDAAVTVIRRDGPDASMEAIARQAGITKPILYRHFGDREGLVHALAERFGERLADDLDARLDLRRLPRPPSPRALLHDTIDAYIAVIEADPGLYTFLTQRGPRRKRGTGVADRVATSIAAALGEGLRLTRYDPGAAEPWSYGIVGLVHLAGEWWVNRPTVPHERLVDYLTDLLWGGLGSALGPLEAGTGDDR